MSEADDPKVSFHYPLFELMSREHGLTLLESEMDEIREVCRKLDVLAEEQRREKARQDRRDAIMANAPDIGQLVSVARWDDTMPLNSKLGDPATVIDVSLKIGRCESGLMVTVRGKNCLVQALDRNWMEEWNPTP